MKKLLFFIALVACSMMISSCALVEEFKTDAPQDVRWVEFEKVANKKTKKKKVMVDLYTNWCTWCKRMDKSTFQDPKIVRYLNKNFYAVKFNAEDRKAIEYNNKTYIFDTKVTSRGRHQLASELLQTEEKVGYPTIVFLDEDMNIIQSIPGYKSAEEFEVIMTYFAGEHYKTTPWREYEKNYQPM